MYIPKIIKIIFDFDFFKKILALAILISVIYFLRSFLLFFLAVFLFSYLFGHLWDFIEKKIYNVLFKFDNKFTRKISEFISFKIIITFLYLLFISVLVFAISNLIPELVQELNRLNEQFPVIWNEIQSIINQLEQIKTINSDISWTLSNILNEKNYNIFIKLLDNLKSFWSFVLQFLLAIIISYIIILDKKPTIKYLAMIKDSNFNFFYKEYKSIFWKIRKGFGLIFRAQAIIAVVNTILTIAWFYLVWVFFGWFSYILTMGIVVFVCSFVPILWMWISAIPLCFIAFAVWWINATILVLWVVIIVHLLEAYILNPKIVSSYLELPISITFIILILSEHFFWIVWFLIWMPLFYILIDIFRDIDSYITKISKKHKVIRNIWK